MQDEGFPSPCSFASDRLIPSFLKTGLSFLLLWSQTILWTLSLSDEADSAEGASMDDMESSDLPEAEDPVEDVCDDFFCYACNKAFKNEKSLVSPTPRFSLFVLPLMIKYCRWYPTRYANHGNSKKHKDNVAKLRSEMEEEDAEFSQLLAEDEEPSLDDSQTNKSKWEKALPYL